MPVAVEEYMCEALAEARRALAVGEVPVGCVFVHRMEKIVGRAGNHVNATKNATRHAELLCIDQVLDYCEKEGLHYGSVFAETSVVVTVEPCIMCSAALHALGVQQVLYGCANDRFGGKSLVDVPSAISSAGRVGPLVRGGICADEAMQLLKEFYKGENPSAPVAKSKR